MSMAIQRQHKAFCPEQGSSQKAVGKKGEICGVCLEDLRFQGPALEPLSPLLHHHLDPQPAPLLICCALDDSSRCL